MTIDELVQKAKAGAKAYALDTAAALSFYAPIMATYEAAQGMPPEQILASRASGAVTVVAGLGRGYGWFRDQAMKITRTTQNSSSLKKNVVESLSQFAYQAPVYAGMLYASGVDPHQIPRIALPGVALCMATGSMYGKYQDRVREHFGMKPGISKTELTHEN